jgi:hypothetical protein
VTPAGLRVALLAELADLGVTRARAIRTEDGGEALYFFSDRKLPDGSSERYVRVEATPDDTFVVQTEDRRTGAIDADERPRRDVASMARFVASFVQDRA